jgi:NDP-sugar pyrophosphorylase family protein
MGMNLNTIDAVILCGGKGLRLKQAVADRPKSMAKIGPTPFLDILIHYLHDFGIRRVILCTGYMKGFIRNYYTSEKKPDMEILFSEENQPLGTGGALKHAEPLIKSNPFLVLNGDSFCPVDLNAFFRFHQEKASLVSAVLAVNENTHDFGVISIDAENRILSFLEKKETHAQNDEILINAGIYLFNRHNLLEIPPDRFYSLEYEFFPAMEGKPFFGFKTDQTCLDIGTPARYERVYQLMQSGKIPFIINWSNNG